VRNNAVECLKTATYVKWPPLEIYHSMVTKTTVWNNCQIYSVSSAMVCL